MVTNAAGGLNEKYTRGDVVVMKDHVNLVGMTGLHPLTGPNEDRYSEPESTPVVCSSYRRTLLRETLLTQISA